MAPGFSITQIATITQPSEAGTKHRPSPVILPSFSALLSRTLHKIPPEPHVTLLSLGAERFQLSDVTLGELDMMLCVSRTRRL